MAQALLILSPVSSPDPGGGSSGPYRCYFSPIPVGEWGPTLSKTFQNSFKTAHLVRVRVRIVQNSIEN